MSTTLSDYMARAATTALRSDLPYLALGLCEEAGEYADAMNAQELGDVLWYWLMLCKELARRIGFDKCFQISYPADCKDANDVLVKHGKLALQTIVETAVAWPIEGIVSMPDMIEDVLSYYENGYPEGTKAGIANFDELLSFYPGQLTVVTGIPGSGKSEFVDWLMASISKKHGWKWGICSFECPPAIHVTKIAEKVSDKSFGFRKDPNHRLSPLDLEYSLEVIDKHFHFINLSLVDVTMDGLIAKAEELVKKKGINGLLFDPWNCIEHKYEENETKYVLECLNKLISFLDKYKVHCFLVAHPTKLKKDPKNGKYEVPTMYSISGSAHFFNRTHNGISVWRDFENNIVDVYVQKVKWSWLGKIGYCSFGFDTMTREYKQI
jgi:twinkle protein